MPVFSPPSGDRHVAAPAGAAAQMDCARPADTIYWVHRTHHIGVIESFTKVLSGLQDRGYRAAMINGYLGELDDEDRRESVGIPTRYTLDQYGRAAVRGWLLAQRAEIEREIADGLKRVRAI